MVCWEYPRKPQMFIKGPYPDSEYTKVPNELLNSPLSTGEKITWIKLLSVTRFGDSCEFQNGIAAVSRAVGETNYNSFNRAVKKLVIAGGARYNADGDLELVIPAERTVVKKPHPKIKEPVSFAEEVATQPKRKPSGISQKDSVAQVTQAWNENKLESYSTEPPRMAPPLFVALETQAKKLGINRPDYPRFVKTILNGCRADEWWAERENLKMSNIFGWGDTIEDKKFRNVEKLYNLGKKYKRPFSWDDDVSVLEHYKKVAPDLEFTSVERLVFDTDEEAEEHYALRQHDKVIYVYKSKETSGGRHAFLWTLFYNRNYNLRRNPALK